MSTSFRQYLRQNSYYGMALFLSHPVPFTPDPLVACTNEILNQRHSQLQSSSKVVLEEEESEEFFLLLSNYFT